MDDFRIPEKLLLPFRFIELVTSLKREGHLDSAERAFATSVDGNEWKESPDVHFRLSAKEEETYDKALHVLGVYFDNLNEELEIPPKVVTLSLPDLLQTAAEALKQQDKTQGSAYNSDDADSVDTATL